MEKGLIKKKTSISWIVDGSCQVATGPGPEFHCGQFNLHRHFAYYVIIFLGIGIDAGVVVVILH